MTREEIIEEIRTQIKCSEYVDEDYADCIKLETLKSVLELLDKEPCEDVISRKAVIDTLDRMLKALEEDSTKEEYYELLKDCYIDLLPVTPTLPICEDAISREAVIKIAKELPNRNPSYSHTCDVVDRTDLIDYIEELPSVTPKSEERPKGKWEYDADKDKSGGHCNRCGHFLRYGEKTNFCPDCGADMREV